MIAQAMFNMVFVRVVRGLWGSRNGTTKEDCMKRRFCRSFRWTFWCDLAQNPCFSASCPRLGQKIIWLMFMRFFGFGSPFWLVSTSVAQTARSCGKKVVIFKVFARNQGGHFWKVPVSSFQKAEQGCRAFRGRVVAFSIFSCHFLLWNQTTFGAILVLQSCNPNVVVYTPPKEPH